MLKNQQFLRLSPSSLTSRTKMGYCPTGPTGTMKTVRSPRLLWSRIMPAISRASS